MSPSAGIAALALLAALAGAAPPCLAATAPGRSAGQAAAQDCPALAGPLAQARAGRLSAASPSEKELLGDPAWQRIDHLADGKQGSGIQILRRFDALAAAAAATSWKLTLALGPVERPPALVTLYGLDGLQLAPPDRHRFWRLAPEGLSQLSVTVRPGPGGIGGIAIATCQGGRMSILTVTVPQGALKKEPATGRLDHNAANQPIIDMQAPLVSPKN